MGNLKAWYVLGIVALLALMVGVMYVNYSNKEVVLRQQIVAKQKANEAVYDNTWKIIKQTAQVTDRYEKGFKEIYSALMEGRYKGERGDMLLKFVNEANPQFDSSVYTKLQNSIEGQRNVWTDNQKMLIDLKREHDTLLTVIPACWFVGGRPRIDIVIVTSERTDKAFSTGKDNDTNLF